MPTSIDTLLVHAGESYIEGAVTMPIFQAVTYLHQEAESYDSVRYSRLNNTPNHLALHEKLATICKAEAALATSSGMAAITTTILGLLNAGDHIVAQSSLYGGTFSLMLRELQRHGISVTLADEVEGWEQALEERTRMLYVESISNPTMRVGALEDAVAFAHENELYSVVDNTFASPINVQPAALGFDVTLHSATKYLNGHSDVVAGAIVGRESLIATLGQRLNLYGATLDPNAAWLLQRGLKTLSLRVARQNQTALEIATRLAEHSRVERVAYPGLETHPDFARASSLLRGAGGMLSFDLADAESAARFCQQVSLAVEAPSLGGIETLVTRPATTSHAGLSAEERAAAGISDGMVRVSTGIEDVEDLWHDFEKALDA